MNSGIYQLRFSSVQGASGHGIAVLSGGTIHGGDEGYVYTGQFREEGGRLRGQMTIKQWNPDATSVFGRIGQFQLDLEATSSAEGKALEVAGSVPGKPELAIKISARKIADLVSGANVARWG
jgi:hypothetical protein